MKKMKFERKDIYKIIGIIFSAILYAFNYKIFVSNGNLFPGGFAGIARIISKSANDFAGFNLPFGVIYWLMNGSVTLLVFNYIGRKFTILSILQFSLSSFLILIIPDIEITHDILLITVFGGILNGVAISVALINEGSSGGFDFIAVFTSIKFNFSTWNYIMYINAAILILAGLLFGWNIALYSIIYQYCTTEVIKTLHKRYKLNALVIITTKEKEVCREIFSIVRHGITTMEAIGEYTGKEKKVMYMICNNFQLNTIMSIIRKTDENAFVSVSSVDKIEGNYYQLPLE